MSYVLMIYFMVGMFFAGIAFSNAEDYNIKKHKLFIFLFILILFYPILIICAITNRCNRLDKWLKN